MRASVASEQKNRFHKNRIFDAESHLFNSLPVIVAFVAFLTETLSSHNKSRLRASVASGQAKMFIYLMPKVNFLSGNVVSVILN